MSVCVELLALDCNSGYENVTYITLRLASANTSNCQKFYTQLSASHSSLVQFLFAHS
jgi:hypothetical protein